MENLKLTLNQISSIKAQLRMNQSDSSGLKQIARELLLDVRHTLEDIKNHALGSRHS